MAARSTASTSTATRTSARTAAKPVVVQAEETTTVPSKKRARVTEEEVVVAAPKVKAVKEKKGKKAAAVVVEAEVEAEEEKEEPKTKSKKAKAVAIVEPVVEVEAVIEVEAEVVEENVEEGEAEIDFLKGFESSNGADSSDEEEDETMDLGEGGSKSTVTGKSFSISSLPKVAAEVSGVQNKLEGKEKKKNSKTGTIYLGRIPHGFHEAEMKSYFSQFGEVTRLRLSRNKTTGASKHYAFLEFAYASVAVIVQETMDNYLLAGHILVCKIVPDDEIHPKMWVGANRVFRVVPKGRKDRVIRTAPKSEEQIKSISNRLLKREEAKRVKLAALSIDYDFKGYAGKAVIGGEDAEMVPRIEGVAGKKGKKAAAKKVPAEKKAVEKKVVEKKVVEKKVVEKKEKVVKEQVRKSEEPAKKKARKSIS